MFFLAYESDGFSSFDLAKQRVDDDVFAFRVSQSEGDYAKLEVQIKNPRVGLLTAARKQWAWLAWRAPDLSVVPLFHGRLVGIPESMLDELLHLTYLGRAEDSEKQKRDLAQSLRVLPYFDPVFIDPTLIHDPDVVLEARSALYHYGRTDKTVSISDIVFGEDGTLALTPADIFNFDMSFAGAPLRSVNVAAEVAWKQAAAGSLDISDELRAAFALAGSSGPITSFTGQGLEAAWLLAGDEIGGGWSVGATRLTLLSSFTNGVTPTFVDVPIIPLAPPVGDLLDPHAADETTDPIDKARFYLWVFSASLSLAYAASRDRSEGLTFTLSADVQDLLTDSAEPRSADMAFRSGLVGAAVDDANSSDATFTGEDLPIGLPSRPSYFDLARGKESLRFLILVARAKLLMSARACNIAADIEFENAVQLSCRMNASLTDARLPGGAASGKVVYYSFGLDGENGELTGKVGISCAIGRGNALAAASAGSPAHSEADFFGADAQEFDGSETALDDVKYENFHMPAVDDGVDFSQMTAAANILSLQVVNGEAAQRLVLAVSQPDTQTAIDTLNASYTKVQLNLRPLTAAAPFRADRHVSVSPLVIPRLIDLEAS